MAKFNLSAAVTVSAFTVVEAETLEEAIEIAEGREVCLHFNGSGTDPREVWCVEDADGDATDIHSA